MIDMLPAYMKFLSEKIVFRKCFINNFLIIVNKNISTLLVTVNTIFCGSPVTKNCSATATCINNRTTCDITLSRKNAWRWLYAEQHTPATSLMILYRFIPL